MYTLAASVTTRTRPALPMTADPVVLEPPAGLPWLEAANESLSAVGAFSTPTLDVGDRPDVPAAYSCHWRREGWILAPERHRLLADSEMLCEVPPLSETA